MTVINLEHITKIEGHANLRLKIENGAVTTCELQAIEGSRYFEGFMKDRLFNEAPEISSRICGICSCAHTICSIQAMENALDVVPSEQTVVLRKLMTMGERIRSHAMHLYFLALPDYLGYESALDMAKKHKDEVQRGLNLMQLGNSMIYAIGGRDLHPVSAAIDGFLKVPKQEQMDDMARELAKAREDAIKTVSIFSRIKYPDFVRETEHFSLSRSGEYAALSGDLKSEKAVFRQGDYAKYIKEYHEPYSTANFVVKEGKSYMVGALSRLMNNERYLSRWARTVHKVRLTSNPFLNNYAQAIELVHCIDTAIDMCSSLKIRHETPPKVRPHIGYGVSAIEVPRGTLFHEYALDSSGKITRANIITPTAQNLRNLQDDIRAFVGTLIDRPRSEIVSEVEKLIRAYDPCFSCSTHFLEVEFL
jgi:coenzyme F420-reducing hydrogenase alpha subunit